MLQFSFQLDKSRVLTNNQAEYEALIIGLEIAKDLNIRYLKVSGDSQLVVRQVTGHYKCNHPLLNLQLEKVRRLAQNFDEICFQHILRLQNSEANQMAQAASGVKIPEGDTEKVIRIQKRFLPFSEEREKNRLDVLVIDVSDDWMVPIKSYLLNPNDKVERIVKCRSINYVLLGQDLYRRTSDGLLLLYVSKDQSMRIMGEVHEGTCGAHQAGDKMRWLIKRHGYYWPNIRADCIQYAKGCPQCQKHGPIQRIPAHQLQSIIKPWPFRGWAIDMIGEIHPAFSLQHQFVASVFNGREVIQYAQKYGIQILNSTPYYAQANGQVESTNKIIKNTLAKVIDDNPREWHDLLPRVLWAYRTSQRESTRVTPFELVYGHAAVLPVEINVQSLRVARHYDPDLQYEEAMFLDIDGLEEKRGASHGGPDVSRINRRRLVVDGVPVGHHKFDGRLHLFQSKRHALHSIVDSLNPSFALIMIFHECPRELGGQLLDVSRSDLRRKRSRGDVGGHNVEAQVFELILSVGIYRLRKI
ncbi:uncharacterized protein LOC131323889 [Rhododendron vialii]|uniref:uncharacterized protein LOC131323889 n=1 Tax=Rhododendron vialii TaxID=182163 RepID=UPI00265EAB3F|nr:uncharacterized protein LOC131323889 [Rhododendron vialii]